MRGLITLHSDGRGSCGARRHGPDAKSKLASEKGMFVQRSMMCMLGMLCKRHVCPKKHDVHRDVHSDVHRDVHSNVHRMCIVMCIELCTEMYSARCTEMYSARCTEMYSARCTRKGEVSTTKVTQVQTPITIAECQGAGKEG